VEVDNSFWRRDVREEYRELVEVEGKGRHGVVLVVFRGEEEVIWGRIQGRERMGIGVWKGEGRTVDRELLGSFFRGFEWPIGEGEILVDVV
jgi:hypothetical protein